MPTASVSRNWLRFILDHNPFYLLSGASMLLGCYLLNSALYTKAGDVRKLLILLATTNVYEILLILLGLVLIRRRGFERDGRMLLALEALFLVDITFINGVISTIDAWWGTLINAVLLSLAAAKLWIILRSLNLPKAGRTWLIILAQTAVLLAVPTLFKEIALPRHGRVSTLAVYATWWIAALLPAFGALLYHLPSRRSQIQSDGVEIGMARAYIILPYVSLLIHLYGAGWVYSVNFASAFISPILLGLAIAMTVCESWLPRRTITQLQAITIAAAVFFSSQFPITLAFSLHNFQLSPLRLSLLAGSLVSLHVLWRSHGLVFALAAVVCQAATALAARG